MKSPSIFWWTLACAVGRGLLTLHLFNANGNLPRAVYVLMGILSFATVLVGGYPWQASRSLFVSRISPHDNVYVPTERQPHPMVAVKPEDMPRILDPPEQPLPMVQLIRQNCIGCHTLERVKNYKLDN